MAETTIEPLALAATATGAASAHRGQIGVKSYQATGTTSAGTGAATIQIQGSNNNSDWVTIGTITLTLGTVSTSDGFSSDDRFGYIRSNVTAISGTGASVNAYMAF